MITNDLSYKHPLLYNLLQEGDVAESNVVDILDEHERTGRATRDILIDMEMITEPLLLERIATLMGTSVLDLSHYEVGLEALHSIKNYIARQYNVVCVESSPDHLVLATYDLIPPEAEDDIKFVEEKGISWVVASESAIASTIKEHYAMDSDYGDMLDAMDNIGTLPDSVDSADESVESLEGAANSAPVVRFVNLVMQQAVADKASDIHFEPFEHEFKIRIRVDGALYEMAPPPKHLAMPIISRVKVMAGLDIAERRLPQDGRIERKIGGEPVDFRVSCLPTIHGESVVLRVLDRGSVGLDLANLGLPEDVFDWFVTDIDKPNGIVIVTGPTGSGKTTTLYAGLDRINTIDTKILTAEEPVEYDIDGIVQVPVNEKVGLTFLASLRAFLRQDPDIIMVGEIRDFETGSIAIQASLTGHLVFSTLHTNDAAGAITRLVDMGIEPFLIASSIEAVMGTRLLRRVCKDCKAPYTPNDESLASLSLKRADIGDQPFYMGEGCDLCNNTGYRGRRGIYEYLRINDPIRDLISDRQPTLIIHEKARELGMRTLREDGIRCILEGSTTVEEVVKYT